MYAPMSFLVLASILLLCSVEQAVPAWGPVRNADTTKYNFVAKFEYTIFPFTTPVVMLSERYCFTTILIAGGQTTSQSSSVTGQNIHSIFPDLPDILSIQNSRDASRAGGSNQYPVIIKSFPNGIPRLHTIGRIFIPAAPFVIFKVCRSFYNSMDMTQSGFFDFSTNNTNSEYLFYQGDVLKSVSVVSYSKATCTAALGVSLPGFTFDEDAAICNDYDTTPGALDPFFNLPNTTYTNLPVLGVDGLIAGVASELWYNNVTYLNDAENIFYDVGYFSPALTGGTFK
ncbi:uncharacterized protein LOC132202628 [Neocloeon triangulifer]|uniref:uncharacterized protein LOC132202628 n=1 Tax=Neocloeon triangulifer TaxID=2078957 RepID=UPI00286F1D70|nr:uncharacterized protein LOC132202628 [Neocloeon triangulifer]